MSAWHVAAKDLWDRFWPALVGGAFGGLVGSLLAFGLWSARMP